MHSSCPFSFGSADVLRGAGLTNAQYNVLAVLAEFGPIAQSELAKRVVVDPRNIVKTVAALLARGLLASTTSQDDGRAKALRLTADGSALLSSLGNRAGHTHEGFTSGLSAEEQAELARLPQKMYSATTNGHASRAADQAAGSARYIHSARTCVKGSGFRLAVVLVLRRRDDFAEAERTVAHGDS
jgi:DNA-binding MarR family transcriptional regulator